jgi:hypothetical protein
MKHELNKVVVLIEPFEEIVAVYMLLDPCPYKVLVLGIHVELIDSDYIIEIVGV